MCVLNVFNIQLQCTFCAHLFIMEVKAEKDALRMREYRRRKQKIKAIHEDFIAFVTRGARFGAVLEFQSKRVMKSSSEQEESLAAQYVLDFDTSLLE